MRIVFVLRDVPNLEIEVDLGKFSLDQFVSDVMSPKLGFVAVKPIGGDGKTTLINKRDIIKIEWKQ